MCKGKRNDKLELESKITSESLQKKRDITQKTSKRKKKDSLFNWLGGFVTKKYKIILIVSVLSLAAAIYPAILLQKELKYNDQDFMPNNLESNIGQQIFQEQFGSNISRLTTIIVLDSDEYIYSENNLAYINALIEGITNSDFIDDIASIDSIISTFNEYNTTYWSEIDRAREMIYQPLLNNITYANTAFHQAANELTNTMQQIAGLYLMSWFNFSRTYYYGLYDANLFTAGPTDPIVLQTIALDTNFTTGFAITPLQVNLVYNLANSIGNPLFVNDQVVNELTHIIANMSLFYASNMSLETYQIQLYPLLQLYHLNWVQEFQQTITDFGMSIVNGTSYSVNMYDNSTLPNAYFSQGTVLGYLQNDKFNCF